MNFPYEFSWKRRFRWKKETVIGHQYNREQQKMTLFFDDGSVKEIKNWHQCEVFLNVDWVLSQKKRMEAQTGQAIPLAVDTDKK